MDRAKMSDNNTTITKDPSLKRYFKFMLTNRKMSVQFTSRKIREIIETDVGIKLGPPQSLYARVCIEAFAYYMQSWPEWNIAIKSQYSDELYDLLMKYLRNKLMYLKQKEQSFKQNNADTNTITLPLPDNMHITITKGMKKVIAPYSLKITVPSNMWNNSNVTLKNFATNHIYVDVSQNKPDSSDNLDISIKDLLNHPFVYSELNIPGLINFSRSCPFKIERYLQTSADDPLPVEGNHIISVENSDKTSPHKVYSYQLMTALFNILNKSMAKFKCQIEESWKTQISTLCDAFLLDIHESNLKKTTVCEGSTVKYNIGKSTYYVTQELCTQNLQNERLILRKVFTPIVNYSLVSCDVTSANIDAKGNFDFFQFVDRSCPMDEILFLNRIKNCLKFKCLSCDIIFTISKLKQHLKDTHPMECKFRCMKCFKYFRGVKLLSKRWKHDCSVSE